MQGVGDKKFGMSLETRETKLFWWDTIQTSWITPHHFILRELISVIIAPPITPNNFWGLKKPKIDKIDFTSLCYPS